MTAVIPMMIGRKITILNSYFIVQTGGFGALGGSVMEYIAVIGSCLCIVICIHGDFLDKLLNYPFKTLP
mgnify:CR=1 FL=1